jgi:RNA polymerase sigma factor, sigma-70 family
MQKLETLYTECVNDLYRYALYATGNPELAREAVSETALAASEGFEKLRNDTLFRAWIFRILSNKCKRQLRSKYNVSIGLDESITHGNIPLTEALEVRESLSVLKADEREIVILSVVDGFTSREIGKIAGIPAATVRSKLARALEKLRKELAE